MFVRLCYGVLGPIASKLSDKFGCRAVTMTGGLLLCIAFVLCTLATRVFHVYLTLGVVGGMNIFVQHFRNRLIIAFPRTQTDSFYTKTSVYTFVETMYVFTI